MLTELDNKDELRMITEESSGETRSSIEKRFAVSLFEGIQVRAVARYNNKGKRALNSFFEISTELSEPIRPASAKSSEEAKNLPTLSRLCFIQNTGLKLSGEG